MDVNDYLIDQAGHDWPTLLEDWSWLLPETFTLWLVNRFGDLFIVVDDGSVHMLDCGAGSITRLADDRDHFASLIGESDNAGNWLMIALVDDCVAAGLTLAGSEIYSYKTPPNLGGEYAVANTEIADLAVHFSVNGQLQERIKDLPVGTTIDRVKI
ncbi:MAG: DUF1851 domain-containing protein [Pseudomonadota bacterium]